MLPDARNKKQPGMPRAGRGNDAPAMPKGAKKPVIMYSQYRTAKYLVLVLKGKLE